MKPYGIGYTPVKTISPTGKLCLRSPEDLLRDRKQLPDVLADWLADMLEGSREKPKGPPGQPWYTNDNRNSAICDAISVLMSLGPEPDAQRTVATRVRVRCSG